MICAKMTPNPTDLPKSCYPSYMKQMLGLHYTESPTICTTIYNLPHK